VTIALVGKYVELHDAYLSVAESLRHGGIANDTDVEINWVNSEHLTKQNIKEYLLSADGILVPGGFGDRGIEGKILASQYARENKVPYFGICLGMQMAVIEFARSICGMKDAHSSEFSETTTHPVIDLMPEQKDIDEMGGTMRLGIYPCKLRSETRAFKIYGDELIYERHRHRYEFNNEFREKLVSKGLILSGLSPSERLVEIVELKDHPWYVGVQFHPEFKSRPNRPHPLFRDFIRASLENKKSKA
jgi:CTP synthase